MHPPEYAVRTLGECLVDSPLGLPVSAGAGVAGYVKDSVRIGVSIEQTPDGLPTTARLRRWRAATSTSR